MKTTMNILLAVPTSLPQAKIPMEMNSTSWYVIGAIVAFLLLIYLFMALIKPEKF
jgi:K+-transporting ATPase KdpF subunit